MSVKLSAFTILRGVYAMGYPWVECALSLIDHVDEFVLAIFGPTADQDSTRYYAMRLQRNFPDKIKVVELPWPDGGVTGRSIGQAQTMALRQCTGDWALCMQADECWWPESAALLRPLVEARPDVHAFVFEFQHIVENFRRVDEHPAYTLAIRLVRNRPDIEAGSDGWTFQGAVHPTMRVALPRPIAHVGQIGGLCSRRKMCNHALLYPDLSGYQDTARAATAELAAGDIGEQWERTEPLVNTPPILRALVGIPEYYVRLELLNGNYRRLLAG